LPDDDLFLYLDLFELKISAVRDRYHTNQNSLAFSSSSPEQRHWCNSRFAQTVPELLREEQYAPCRLQVISMGPNISSGSRYICSPRRDSCNFAPTAHSGIFLGFFSAGFGWLPLALELPVALALELPLALALALALALVPVPALALALALALAVALAPVPPLAQALALLTLPLTIAAPGVAMLEAVLCTAQTAVRSSQYHRCYRYMRTQHLGRPRTVSSR
jgi:hypothetical protein